MARNRNREFSEGNGLNPKDLGTYAHDTEERLPSWAQRDGEEDMSSWKRPSPNVNSENMPEETDLPEAPTSLPEAPAPDEPLAEETQPAPDTAPNAEQDTEPEAEPPKENPGETPREAGEMRESIVQTRADKALWQDEPREAQRVESGVFNRRNPPDTAKAGENPSESKKAKGKKTGKKPSNKGKKGKKAKRKRPRRKNVRASCG